MIPNKIRVWTASKGYVDIEEVNIGDKVISLNTKRNCTEYDTVSNIQTDYVHKGTIGFKKADLHFTLTPDHPLMIINPFTKEIIRKPIDDMFMRGTGKHARVVGNRLFEPYKRGQDTELIQWTARMAATASRQVSPPLYYDEIWNCLKDITGEEAQIWLQTFFHWNILKYRPFCMKTVLLQNKWVKEMVYHTAPRAGLGTYWGSLRNKSYHHKFIQALSITKSSDVVVGSKLQWRADRHEGIVYNISTQNGSFLARYLGGTFLLACNYT